VGKGTGLGLSTVYGIVKQCNGYVVASSEVGQGATFNVYLPRIEQGVETPHASESSTATCRGSETVLLVEDEDGVRSLISMLLQKSGYTVLEARDPEEALDLCQQNTPIHLLLTDLILPKMSGRELAERVAAQHQSIRTLFISGYTDDEVIRAGVLDRRAAFLQKPFSTDVLLQKVREVLGRAAAAH
jgi:CheY-like chemotaxis protein